MLGLHTSRAARDPAIVRGKLVNGTPGPRTPLNDEQIHLLREGQLQRDNLQLRKRVAELESQVRRPLDLAAGPAPDPGSVSDGGATPGDLRAPLPPPAPESTQHDPLRQLTHVIGVPQDHSSPTTATGTRRSPDPVPLLPDLPTRSLRSLANADLYAMVPILHSKTIVRASLKFVAFMHTAVHVPTWLADHDRWIEALGRGQGRDKSDAWLSTYFVILTVGMYFCDDLLGPDLGISAYDASQLAQMWFDVCLEALNRSKFLSTNPTLEALQTITIIPVVAYNLGASAYAESLLHLGLRIAQLLRLHLLGPEPAVVPPGLIQREVGRRIWLVLRLAESRPDFTQPGTLCLPPGQTAEPHNADDEDIEANHPLTEHKLTSHLIIVTRRFGILRKFADALTTASSLKDQYAIAIAAEQTLRSSIADWPWLAETRTSYPAALELHAPYDGRAYTQYIWSVLKPAGTIIVYRSLMGRAYTDERFAAVRRHCIDAAREILEARRRNVPSLFKRAWPIAGYTVVAGLILATELMHGSPDPSERTILYSEIELAISKLWECGTASVVVQRGAALLQSFLERSRAAEAAAAAVAAVPAVETLWPSMALDPDVFPEDMWNQTIGALETQDPGSWWGGMGF